MQSNDEKSLRQLIAAAVKGGYLVTVFGVGESTVRRSTDAAEIFDAATGVDMAGLGIWKTDGKSGSVRVGWMLLVYGNNEETVVADYVDKPELEALYDASLVKMEE